MNQEIRDRARQQAIEIGLRIERDLDGGRQGLQGLGFARGRSGLAVFFSYLFRVTGEARFGKRALSLSQDVCEKLECLPVAGGLNSGRLGAAISLIQVARILGREDLEAAGAFALTRAASGLARGDVYVGLAGAVLAALKAGKLTEDRVWFRRAEDWASPLVAELIRPRSNGAAFVPDRPALFPLLGFAHGASGGALALAALGQVTREPLYVYMARSLLQYEDCWYRSEWLNWPDGRLLPGDLHVHARALATAKGRKQALRPAHSIAWCSGKSGLIAARLVTLCQWHITGNWAGLGIDRMRDPIWRWRGRGVSDHTVCCGYGGAIELHILAWRFFQHLRFERFLEQSLLDLVELRNTTGDWIANWRICSGHSYNGFLKGRGGVGYMMLRMADLLNVPSQLLLDADTIKPAAMADSARLRQQRRQILQQRLGGCHDEIVSHVIDEGGANLGSSIAQDLTRLENMLAERVAPREVETRRMESAIRRGQIERECDAVLARPDDITLPWKGPEDSSRCYVLAPDVAVFEEDQRLLVVARRLGFATLTVANGWSRHILRMLKSPKDIGSIASRLGAQETFPPSRSELITALRRLWAAGVLTTAAPEELSKTTKD